MPFQIKHINILELEVDALVNSTNFFVYGFSGVDKLIHEYGGEEFEKECDAISRTLHYGEAAWTKAYGDLKCRYVIHTSGPVYADGNRGEPALLRSCYFESLRLADNLGCKSIAFPLMCTGAMGYPASEALGIAIGKITEYLTLINPELYVTLAIYGSQAEAIMNCNVEGLNEYIDGCSGGHGPIDISIKTPEPLYQLLRSYIDKSGMKDSDVYGALYMPRQTFNKIINGVSVTPKKETLIGIALILKLSISDLNKLLSSAGLALSDNVFDQIVRYFFTKRIYDLYELNTQLVKFGQQPIFTE